MEGGGRCTPSADIQGGFLQREAFKTHLEGGSGHRGLRWRVLPVVVSSLQLCLNVGINYKYAVEEAA